MEYQGRYNTEHENINFTDPCLTNVPPLRQNYTREATNIRDKFRDYFNSEAGSVPWQWEKIN